MLDDPIWRERVEAELARDHDELPWQGLQVATRLGIPVRDVLVTHLERHPEDSGAWFHLVRGADAETLDEALELVRLLCDLDELGAGPANELFRPGVFVVADFFLQALIEHPGKGWEVIRPALRSPVIRNRHFALRSLSRWPPGLVSEEQRAAVAEVAEGDPDDEVRDQARRVLLGERIDPPDIDFDDEHE